jgi:hypothetical protein
MQIFIVVFVIIASLPGAADEGFSLGLAEMDFTEPHSEAAPDRDFGSLATDTVSAGHETTLVYEAALKPRTPNEHTRALWNSDLGRVHLALAAEHAMLGREGLVNGGRMAGLGMATAGIGDGDPNGSIGLVLGRARWVEMNANEKLQTGVEASILAALLYFMVANAD